jgi:hypothetical protein
MASNATVEQLKALGMRHGEKAVVGLAAVLCLLFLFMAVTRPTIDITPKDVKEHATAAQTNLNKPQGTESILVRLDNEFLKKPEFEQQVDKLAGVTLNASIYKPKQPWVYNEPGAGLLRDDPELIAVSDLYAYPGRGGALVYELKDGERVPDDGKNKPDDFTLQRRKKKRRRSNMMGGMGSMMAGGMGGRQRARPKKSAADRKREQEREIAEQVKEKSRVLAGKGEEAKVKVKVQGEGDEGPERNDKEITKGLRWVVLTGTLDYKKLRDNYYKALKRKDIAYPHFRQGLDLQRQELQDDGSWSDWEDVDRDKNNEVLDNLPENEEELVPDDALLEDLIDPLPFLKAGYWERVHVASLVPKEKKEVTKPAEPAGGGMMGPGGMEAAMRGMGSGGMRMDAGAMAKMMGGGMPRMGSGEGMMGMMGSGYGGGTAEDTNFDKTEADTVMIRALDFTAEPDTTYRYRVRIVVFNPNKGHEDVNPGVNSKDEHLSGPWSEPTGDVTMPADVTPYAMEKARAGQRDGEVSFMVTRWNPDDGVTVVRTFQAAPGDLIGDPRSSQIPSSEGKGAHSKLIDFNSRDVVLDTGGGVKPLPPVGASGGAFNVPALSLLVRPDGTVVLRNQAFDTHDEVRKDIDSNYKKEVAESTKKRESSTGYGSGMMGSMMMGGGMRGGANLPGMGAGGAGYR